VAKSKNICTVEGCPNKGRYCRLHISFSVPEKKVISKVSDNHKEVLKKYKTERARYLKEHPLCEANIDGCTKVSVEIHHKAGKASDELYLDSSLYLSCCRHCHDILETNPAYAKQQGFSVSRLSKDLNKRA
jgi:hypothetical protein